MIANSTVRLRKEDVLDLFRPLAGDYPCTATRFVPSVFSPAQAAWIDLALARADRRAEPVRSLLLLAVLKVILRMQPMSLLRGTDARAAATGDYDRVSPRRLAHYVNASQLLTLPGTWRVAQEVNGGVFGGSGEAHKGDAIAMLSAAIADVVYFDPPYAQTASYADEYGVLDALLHDDVDAEAPALDDLLEAAHDIPIMVLSYGGPTLTLDDLSTLVARHRMVTRAIAVPYAHLRSIATEVKNASNQEYLIIATR